jgi:hypothetical protein
MRRDPDTRDLAPLNRKTFRAPPRRYRDYELRGGAEKPLKLLKGGRTVARLSSCRPTCRRAMLSYGVATWNDGVRTLSGYDLRRRKPLEWQLPVRRFTTGDQIEFDSGQGPGYLYAFWRSATIVPLPGADTRVHVFVARLR